MLYVNTTKAAALSGISPRRFRDFLGQGRVKGAYKCGHFWLIPLYNGLPIISEKKYGRAGTWKKTTEPKKTIVHINSKHIKHNIDKAPEERKPVIAVKGKNKFYASALEIPYPCRIVYEPKGSKKYGGARVWIEILGDEIELVQAKSNLMDGD